MKMVIKCAAILLLVLFAFMFGANQHRINGWPFDQGYFGFVSGQTAITGIGNSGYKDKKKQIPGWVEKLKRGGYIIYFRHANREKWPEVAAFDVYELATKLQDPTQTTFRRAVCLSEQGIEEAKLIGKIFQLAKIPTGTVVSIPSCRARETANYAFGRIDKLDNSVLTHGLLSEKAFPGFVAQLRTLLLNVDIKPGTNTVFTGHSATLERNAGLGIDGEILSLDETGFYIIERNGNDKLAVVYSIKSISDLAVSAIDLPLN